jgi:hypothetical protein
MRISRHLTGESSASAVVLLCPIYIAQSYPYQWVIKGEQKHHKFSSVPLNREDSVIYMTIYSV